MKAFNAKVEEFMSENKISIDYWLLIIDYIDYL